MYKRQARNYGGLKRVFAAPEQISAMLQAVTVAGAPGATRDGLAKATAISPAISDRILIWLLKYVFRRRVKNLSLA